MYVSNSIANGIITRVSDSVQPKVARRTVARRSERERVAVAYHVGC